MKDIGPPVKLMIIAAVLGLITGLARQAAAKPLKVFILAGQSNIQGHVNVSTFDSLDDDPQTAPLLQEMRHPDGTPRVCDKVWISSIGCAGDDTTEQTGRLTTGFGASKNEIGPEFTFGIYMKKLLGEPILLIKTSWGGKSLITGFRPPSAGKRVFNDVTVRQWKQRGLDVNEESAQINKTIGVYYRLMIVQVKKVLADIQRVVPDYDPRQGYEVAGFVWFQGWNDYVDDWSYPRQPGQYDEYRQLLEQFIRDVRRDLGAPKLPFVIGVMGVGGVQEDHKPPMSTFRHAQAAPASLPEFQRAVVAVPTAPFWDDSLDELHRRWDAIAPKINEQTNEAVKKNPQMTPAARAALRQEIMAEYLTPEDRHRLKAISHWDCHYHGAVKIMAPIGKAFAETMARLQKIP